METDIKKYFNFEWHATRKNFWMFQLLLVLIGGTIGFMQVNSEMQYNFAMANNWEIIGNIVTLITLIPSIAINKARLNDAGWSGWWMLMPILNIIVMGFFKTKEEDNKYNKSTIQTA